MPIMANFTIRGIVPRATLLARAHHWPDTEHRRAPVIDSQCWEAWVPKFLDRLCEAPRNHERYTDA